MFARLNVWLHVVEMHRVSHNYVSHNFILLIVTIMEVMMKRLLLASLALVILGSSLQTAEAADRGRDAARRRGTAGALAVDPEVAAADGEVEDEARTARINGQIGLLRLAIDGNVALPAVTADYLNALIPTSLIADTEYLQDLYDWIKNVFQGQGIQTHNFKITNNNVRNMSFRPVRTANNVHIRPTVFAYIMYYAAQTDKNDSPHLVTLINRLHAATLLTPALENRDGALYGLGDITYRDIATLLLGKIAPATRRLINHGNLNGAFLSTVQRSTAGAIVGDAAGVLASVSCCKSPSSWLPWSMLCNRRAAMRAAVAARRAAPERAAPEHAAAGAAVDADDAPVVHCCGQACDCDCDCRIVSNARYACCDFLQCPKFHDCTCRRTRSTTGSCMRRTKRVATHPITLIVVTTGIMYWMMRSSTPQVPGTPPVPGWGEWFGSLLPDRHAKTD